MQIAIILSLLEIVFAKAVCYKVDSDIIPAARGYQAR